MSLDLNDYFSLGLESTNQPIENAGMINVFRTPVDTSSANLNRVTFKFPKTGLLTADSMITLQFIRSDSSTAQSDLTPNFVNGAIGAIKRTRILINNKTIQISHYYYVSYISTHTNLYLITITLHSISTF